MDGLAPGTRPCTFGCVLGDSPIPSESGAGPESGFGSPAPQLLWDLRTKALTVTGWGHGHGEPDRVGLNHSEGIFRIT